MFGVRKNIITRAAVIAVLAAPVFVLMGPSGVLGARAKQNTKALCVECHKTTADYYKAPVVHKPVAAGECAACHNPHSSKHGSLLADRPERICFDCHDKNKILSGSVRHDPVERGKCLDCHDPHSSRSKGLLKAGGAEICFTCHNSSAIRGGRNTHAVVSSGNCGACHNPHASNTTALLRKAPSVLCMDCHSKGASRPIGSHLGYDVTKSDCGGCHDPHSSDGPSMERNSRHKPFAEKNCAACHSDPKSPGRLVDSSSSLCTKCHKDSLGSFNKRYSHRGKGVASNACLDCHSPHAGDDRSLGRSGVENVCYSCHRTTKVFVKESRHRHPGLQMCFNCHAGHASDYRSMMKLGDKTCSTEKCHPAQGRFNHPQGEKTLDPRSKEAMDCVSCHNPMGTYEEYILKGDKVSGLCQQCHKM